MRKKKDQGIEEVLGNVGFVFEVFKAIAHAVLAKGGTMEHLRRLVKESQLQRQIADLIVPAGSVVTYQPHGEGEYRAFVSYAPLPSKAQLEAEFGKGNVSDIFDGRPFEKLASCLNMDETPEVKDFLVKCFGRETQSEDNIAEMDALGYRPATHIEAYEFQKVYPELQHQFWIVALGSFAKFDGRRFVAVLNADGFRRIFGSYWFGRRWGARGRFLFVRK